MCITEDKLVDCYETGLFNRILFEVEYNRRKKAQEHITSEWSPFGFNCIQSCISLWK